MMFKTFSRILHILAIFISTILSLAVLVCTVQANPSSAPEQESARLELSEKFGRFITNKISDALDGVIFIPKEYRLSDENMVAPEPNSSCYGYTDDPTSLVWLIEDAEQLLDGQELIFHPDVTIPQDSQIKYYLDDTILSITWKQVIGAATYTFSEVKI